MPHRAAPRALVGTLAAALLLLAVALSPSPRLALTATTTSYRNPLTAQSSLGPVDSCPDPAVIRGRGTYAGTWYLYCTADALSSTDRTASGALSYRRIPMLRSTDLVTWRYVAQAVPTLPAWASKGARLWAPDVFYSSTFGRYYLTFTVTDTVDAVSGEPGCPSDRAIAQAVGDSPTGPWKVAPTPLVAPRRLGPGCDFASTIDSDVRAESLTTSSTLTYGGFRGGITARPVTIGSTGIRLAGAATTVTTDRKYEGANTVYRDGWYYLVVSSGSCCRGSSSGYGVFVGRSRRATGPFVDADGRGLTDGFTGGTPFLVASGNRWLAPGHTSMFLDRAGQWWVAYHAVDRLRPTFDGTDVTRRPVLLDPVDWYDGWPVVRGGLGASTGAVPLPAAQAGQPDRYTTPDRPTTSVGPLLADSSDELDGPELDARWQWVRPEASTGAHLDDGVLELDTASTQLVEDHNTAAVLLRSAPAGDYTVETRLDLDLPADGEVALPVQAGLVVYGDDDAFVKLTTTAVGHNRQTAMAMEQTLADGRVAYGSSTAGPPGGTTWLRISRVTGPGGRVVFTAFTSLDGSTWRRGPSWRDEALTPEARIGLVAMGGAGYHARFSYLRVFARVS